MATTSEILKGMPVLDSAGVEVGHVDDVGADHIKLTRKDSPDGRHHIPMAWVARVDRHVHLSRTADMVARAPLTPQTGALGAPVRRSPILWIAAAAIGLLVVLLLARSCNSSIETSTVTGPSPQTTAAAGAPSAPVRVVTLPNGRRIDMPTGSMNSALQVYLASAEATPRTFTFDDLNFDTGSAVIRPLDQATLSAVAEILGAYPSAKVRIAGYADARGGAGANAGLGQARAQSVVAALVAHGVSAARLAAVSGGEGNPIATNQTPSGRAENRRTDLIITDR